MAKDFDDRLTELDNEQHQLLAALRFAKSSGNVRQIMKLEGALAQLDDKYRELTKHVQLPIDDLPRGDDPGPGAGNGAWRSVVLMAIALVSAVLTVAVL